MSRLGLLSGLQSRLMELAGLFSAIRSEWRDGWQSPLWPAADEAAPRLADEVTALAQLADPYAFSGPSLPALVPSLVGAVRELERNGELSTAALIGLSQALIAADLDDADWQVFTRLEQVVTHALTQVSFELR
jgi:hypothetical protein